tara:strand:- start:54 stop:434 length:381 start_codon:yes stop_codon:yes gene_type:complete
MILLDTYLSKSKIHGIGVFTKTPIKKGSQVCDYDSPLAKQFEIKFSEKEVLTYPKVIRNFLLTYGYEEPLGSDNLYVSLDHEKFLNSADNPNISYEGFALRDINKDEELCYDYKTIDSDYEKHKYI